MPLSSESPALAFAMCLSQLGKLTHCLWRDREEAHHTPMLVESGAFNALRKVISLFSMELYIDQWP